MTKPPAFLHYLVIAESKNVKRLVALSSAPPFKKSFLIDIFYAFGELSHSLTSPCPRRIIRILWNTKFIVSEF